MWTYSDAQSRNLPRADLPSVRGFFTTRRLTGMIYAIVAIEQWLHLLRWHEICINLSVQGQTMRDRG